MTDISKGVAKAVLRYRGDDPSASLGGDLVNFLWEEYAETEWPVILQAIEQAGYAIRPVEPNEAMATAGAMAGEWHRGNLPNATDVYKAMLTAYKEGK